MIWSSSQGTFHAMQHQMVWYDLWHSRTFNLPFFESLAGWKSNSFCQALYRFLSATSDIQNYFDFVMQVKIQKDSEVRLKIVGTRVDVTEIVSLCCMLLVFFNNFLYLT